MKLNIVNSLQPQAIGDAISAFPMLWAVSRSAPLSVYFSCTSIRPLCTFAETADQPLDARTLDIQEFADGAEARGLHLGQSWFWRLGMEPPEPPFAWPKLPVLMPPEKFDLAIAPFSGSDPAGNAPRLFYSARWPSTHWFELLSELGPKRVCLLSGAADSPGALQDFATVLAGRDLRAVCGVLRSSALVLTIDNGIGWLAQALGCPHLLLQASRHRRTWTRNPNRNAINVPNSADAMSVLNRVNILLEGKPLPVEHDMAFDPKIARLELLRAMRFAVHGDREAAAASYRFWREHATPAQLPLLCFEAFIAIGRMVALRASRRSRH